MDRRLELHEILCKILGSRCVYFQPPESLKMTYPCIRYKVDGFETDRADNTLYHNTVKYSITYIDRNPDNRIKFDLLQIPMMTLERAYQSDGLNHYIYNLYY